MKGSRSSGSCADSDVRSALNLNPQLSLPLITEGPGMILFWKSFLSLSLSLRHFVLSILIFVTSQFSYFNFA